MYCLFFAVCFGPGKKNSLGITYVFFKILLQTVIRYFRKYIAFRFHFFSFTGALPEEHEIKSLPGLSETPSFKQYAGYVTVDESHGRRLFYW